MHVRCVLLLARGGSMLDGGAVTVESLRRIVDAHRVYYEVAPEIDILGEERQLAGYELRLWASHEAGARALPGCRKCWDIFEDLQQLAAWLAQGEEPEARWEVQAFDRLLYDSRQFRATDEIDLSLRLFHLGGNAAPERACQRSLRRARQRLAALGVQEGTWHPVPGGPHTHP